MYVTVKNSFNCECTLAFSTNSYQDLRYHEERFCLLLVYEWQQTTFTEYSELNRLFSTWRLHKLSTDCDCCACSQSFFSAGWFHRHLVEKEWERSKCRTDQLRSSVQRSSIVSVYSSKASFDMRKFPFNRSQASDVHGWCSVPSFGRKIFKLSRGILLHTRSAWVYSTAGHPSPILWP